MQVSFHPRSARTIASAAGAPAAVVEQALRQADKLDAWPVKKVPDDGHLPEPQRLDLAYALSRRAWSARDDVADPRVLLAEQRAYQDVKGRLRPMLREIFELGAWQANGAFVYRPKDEAENALLQLQGLDIAMTAGAGAKSADRAAKAVARLLLEGAKAKLAEASEHEQADRRDPAHQALGFSEGLRRAAEILAAYDPTHPESAA